MPEAVADGTEAVEDLVLTVVAVDDRVEVEDLVVTDEEDEDEEEDPPGFKGVD